MSVRAWYALLAVTFALFSCAPKPVVKEEKLGVEEVFRRVQARNVSIETLKGFGNISVESPEVNSSGAFQLAMYHRDSLLLVLRGPFGIHVGSLSLTKQSFVFYNSLENTVLSGVPDSSTLLSILHFHMPVAQMLDALLGGFPAVQDSVLRFAETPDEYLMAFSRSGKIYEYRIDSQTFIITDFLIKDSQDKVLFKATASGIASSNDIDYPSVLKIAFPDEGRTISLVYKGMTINEDVECALTVPEDAEVIRK